LYILCVCFAKLSIIVLLRMISPGTVHRRLGLSIGVLIALWGLIPALVSVLQCKAPHVWETENNICLNKSAFWHSVGAINIFTDLMLVLLPVYIVKGLNMKTEKKVTVIGCFAARSIDVLATAFQLAYTSGFSSSDFTSRLWQWVLMAQLIQTITITTSCIPYLRPLLDSYPQEMFVIDETMLNNSKTARTANGYARKTNHIYILRDVKSDAYIKSTHNSHRRATAEDYADLESRNITTHAEIETIPLDERGKWDASSQRSQSRMIKATTTIDTKWQEA